MGGGLAMQHGSPSVTLPSSARWGEMRNNGEEDVSLVKNSWTHIFEMSRREI